MNEYEYYLGQPLRRAKIIGCNHTVQVIDPPRHVDFVEVDRNGNELSIERFHGNGIIEKIK